MGVKRDGRLSSVVVSHVPWWFTWFCSVSALFSDLEFESSIEAERRRLKEDELAAAIAAMTPQEREEYYMAVEAEHQREEMQSRQLRRSMAGYASGSRGGRPTTRGAKLRQSASRSSAGT